MKKTIQKNLTCLNCGLLKSTIDACKTSCTMKRQHDFQPIVFEKPDKYFAPPPQEVKLTRAYKLCLKMLQLNPGVMAKVMAWNNTAMEFDIPEDKELQQKYLKLQKEAEWELGQEEI